MTIKKQDWPFVTEKKERKKNNNMILNSSFDFRQPYSF